MVRVAIVGASGYTGAESIEFLLGHSEVEVTYVTASTDCGPVAELFPQFRGRCGLVMEALDVGKLAELADVAFCCLPHKVAMSHVPEMLDAGVRVVDFSADYRIKNVAAYEKYYQVEHTDTENLKHSVYGLPELFRDEIRGARLVANPGCYPTSFMLSVAPLLKSGLIDASSIIDNAVSGASGAGKKPSSKFHFPNMNENLFAYGIGTHRHTPEMEEVAGMIGGCEAGVLFQPHVGTYDRGILSSVYCKATGEVTKESVGQLYHDFYSNERFVQVCDEAPAVKDVSHTNYCHVHATVVKDTVVCFSAIDNLVKGASGQAIQNMNVMFGLDESMGLL